MKQQQLKTFEELSNFINNFYSTDLILSYYLQNLQQMSPEEFLVEAKLNTESVRKIISEQYDHGKSIQLLEIWKLEIAKYLTNLISLSMELEKNKNLLRTIITGKEGKQLLEARSIFLQITNWHINYFTLLLLYAINKVVSNELESKYSKTQIRGILLSFQDINPIERSKKLNTFIKVLITQGFIMQEDSILLERLFLGEDLNQKINWLGQINELGYLFNKLNNPKLNIITRSSDSNELWKRIAQCFYVKGLDKKALDFNQNHIPKKPHLRRALDKLVIDLISN